MDRRKFIKLIGSSSFLIGGPLAHASLIKSIGDTSSWKPMKIRMPRITRDINSAFIESGIDFFIHGGAVASFHNGTMPSQVSIIAKGGDITLLRRRLFELKVTAIPNLGRYDNIMEFIHNDIRFIVEYFPEILSENNFADVSRAQMIFFRHNKLIYDLKNARIFDPENFMNSPVAVETCNNVSGDIEEHFSIYCIAHREAELFNLDLGQSVCQLGNSVLAEVCPFESSKKSAIVFIGESDTILKRAGMERFSAIIKSPYVTSAFKKWVNCDVSNMPEKLKMANKLGTKENSDALVASGLLIMISLVRKEQTFAELPLNRDEIEIARNYIPKITRAIEVSHDLEFLNLYI